MENFEYITLTEKQYNSLEETIRTLKEDVTFYKNNYETLVKAKIEELSIIVDVEETEHYFASRIYTNSKTMPELSEELKWYKKELNVYKNKCSRYMDEMYKFNHLPWYKKLFYKINL